MTALRVLAQSLALAAAACGVLYGLALALPTVVSDPVLLELQRDALGLAQAQPWLVGWLWLWVASCLVVAARAQPTQ